MMKRGKKGPSSLSRRRGAAPSSSSSALGAVGEVLGAATGGGGTSPKIPVKSHLILLAMIAVALFFVTGALYLATTSDPAAAGGGKRPLVISQILRRGNNLLTTKNTTTTTGATVTAAAEDKRENHNLNDLQKRLDEERNALAANLNLRGAGLDLRPDRLPMNRKDAGGAAAAAGGDNHHGMELDLKPYDTPPTEDYPYPLIPLDMATYDIHRDYRVKGGRRFSEYTLGGTPYLITNEIRTLSDQVARTRRQYVKHAMQFAWNDGYVKYAFGMDEVTPQTGRGSNNWGGQGITLVDSLDTLWLMDMKDEFYQARDWVRDKLSHANVGSVSVFETTIRDLGGLLAAYDWSGDRVFLTKAQDLGDRLLKAFDGSVTGIPAGMVSLSNGDAKMISWAGGNAILAEFGTMQVEFRYLSKVTGNPIYAEKTEHVFEILHEMSTPNGLYPYFFRVSGRNGDNKPSFGNDKLTFGAMADSVYEYMLKIWLQGGKTEPMYREMYDKAMDGMHAELLQTSTPSKLTYIADKNSGHLDHKMDHLVCFMGGLLALGAYTNPNGGLESERSQRDMRTAKALTYTCYQMYARMNTGISAEFVQFHAGQDFDIGHGAPHYLLRPEAVESFFVLHQLTGDPVYREWGWEVFQSIEKYCKAKVAYGSLNNVQETDKEPRDKMESFFLAETLKYLYLLFDPDTEVDILNRHVFNTEAHPLRIFPLLDQ